MENNLQGTLHAILENQGNIDFDYDLSHFEKPSSKYDHELCRLACKFATIGYNEITDDPEAEKISGFPYTQAGVKAVLDGMGFLHREIQPKAARDEESYFIASRQLSLGQKEYDFYIAAFSGSYKKTWFSNFDPLGKDRICNEGKGYAGDSESGAIHLGFADARDYVHEKIRAFIKKNRSGNPIKILITGHSRGAATANLLAAKIIKNGGFGTEIDIESDNIYTYAFASPNYANKKFVDVSDKRFRRIFNIVSPEDFVTEVFPKSCGYGKYGTVYSIFGKDNQSKKDYAREKAVMTRFFSNYRAARPYVSYKDGNQSVEKIIEVMAQSMTETIDLFYTKKMRLCFKKCTPFEYFKKTLCTFVGGNDSPEDKANIATATKLLIASSIDTVGTSAPFRKLSAFFVFKQGIAGVTGGKFGEEYFNDAHISETYLSYLMSMNENQLIKIK